MINILPFSCVVTKNIDLVQNWWEIKTIVKCFCLNKANSISCIHLKPVFITSQDICFLMNPAVDGVLLPRSTVINKNICLIVQQAFCVIG